ncbi:unnamed protein product [Cochlearia groenlandica]
MENTKNISLSIFWFVLISTFGVVFAQECDNTGIFEINSTYDYNRDLVFASLAYNVTHHGFYSSAIGEGLDRIYGMGLCINDSSEQSVCSECIQIAVEQLKYNCPNNTEAYTWTPHKTLCFARYSNVSFHGKRDDHPHYWDYKNLGIKVFFDAEKDWDGLMKSMRNQAQAKNGSFAYEFLPLKDHQALYGFMQCTPDVNKNDCGTCLDDCIRDYDGNLFRGKQGGMIAYPNCYFRWDLYPFVGAFNLTHSSPADCKKNSPAKILAVVVPTTVIIAIMFIGLVVYVYRTRKIDPPAEVSTTSSLQYDLKTIEDATCTFSRCNILGQGGFGEVFKGVLQDKSEIAVKRLSKESAQGVQEFKNETRLVAKLQHRNLVTVLGFCMEGEEKILVYEFVPNKSLDHFLFEPTKQGLLDWTKRYEIIVGTAKGILYLHHDSPLKIIHRDLKASNILLDADMKPKVADLLARILEMDQSRADTRRVVGTHGYIAPEYMMHGQFSAKSDVYSFGVLVLEIINGQRNSNFHEIDHSGKSLVTHAWKHWRNGSPLELMDSELGKNYSSDEVIRCIHIALLCLQNDPEARPSFSTIILMLTCDSYSLPVPQSPVYEALEMGLPPITSVHVSTNDSLIDDLVAR